MPRVEEFNEIAELAQLRPVWQHLLEKTPGATFFHTLDWLEVYWAHFGADQRLRVMLVTECEEVTAIVPLVVRQEATRVGKIRFLTYPLDYWGSFYGPIGPDPLAALGAAFRHVQRTQRDWDAIELRWIAEKEVGRVERAMCDAGLGPQLGLRESSALIDLSLGWEPYWASRTSKWRNNQRRQERGIRAAGEVEYIRHRPNGGGQGDPRWDLFEACVAVARSSWQGRSDTGTTLSHDSVASFLREVHGVAAGRGGVDLNLLQIDGVPIAFAYNYVFNGNVYGLRAGFDAKLAPPGAGNFLTAQVIRDSFQRGDRVYDLGPGHLKTKRHLHTEVCGVYRCGHFPWYSLRSQLLRAKRCYDRLFEQAV